MMEEQHISETATTDPKLIVGAAIILIIAAAILALAIVGRQNNRASGLLPNLATPTTITAEEDAVMQLTFSELNADPLAYVNRKIQVSGSYLPLDPPACAKFSGPAFRWSLVAEDLQLDIRGFERIVRILPQGTEMKIRGTWRLYQGPLGCGKGPTRDSAWYLQAEKIIEPNPLVGAGIIVGIENASGDLPQLVPTLTITPTPLPSATATTTFEATLPATVTLDPLLPTVTVDPSLPLSPTSTPPSSVTPPATGTSSAPGTPGSTATPGATMTPASGGGAQPTNTPETVQLPTATQSSGSYPGEVTNTPRPTATSPYP
jgi:hypothetical protein